MEYSKEDLIEAKSKILGYEENIGTEESKKIWEKNAQFWDNAMGDESNEFHREVWQTAKTETSLLTALWALQEAFSKACFTKQPTDS